jgi:type IV secretory pathway TrbD component
MRQRQIAAEYCAAVRQSPNRPQLWGGMEWQMAVVTGYICWMSVLCLENRYGVLLAILMFLLMRGLGRAMAKRDPYLIRVYLADRWKDFYTALPMAPQLIRVGRR